MFLKATKASDEIIEIRDTSDEHTRRGPHTVVPTGVISREYRVLGCDGIRTMGKNNEFFQSSLRHVFPGPIGQPGHCTVLYFWIPFEMSQTSLRYKLSVIELMKMILKVRYPFLPNPPQAFTAARQIASCAPYIAYLNPRHLPSTSE